MVCRPPTLLWLRMEKGKKKTTILFLEEENEEERLFVYNEYSRNCAACFKLSIASIMQPEKKSLDAH